MPDPSTPPDSRSNRLFDREESRFALRPRPPVSPFLRPGKGRLIPLRDAPVRDTSKGIELDDGPPINPAPNVGPLLEFRSSQRDQVHQSSITPPSPYGGSSTVSSRTDSSCTPASGVSSVSSVSSVSIGSPLAASKVYELHAWHPSFYTSIPGVFTCAIEGCQLNGCFLHEEALAIHVASQHGNTRHGIPRRARSRGRPDAYFSGDSRAQQLRQQIIGEILDRRRGKQNWIDCPIGLCERRGFNGFQCMEDCFQHFREIHLIGEFETQQEQLRVAALMNDPDSISDDDDTAEAQKSRSGGDAEQINLATLKSTDENISQRAGNHNRNSTVPRYLKEKEPSTIRTSAEPPNEWLRSNGLTSESPSTDQFPVLATLNQQHETSTFTSDDWGSNSAASNGSFSSSTTEDSHRSTKDRMLGILSSILLRSYSRLALMQRTITANQQNGGERSQSTANDGQNQESPRKARSGSKRKEVNSGDEPPSKGKDRQYPKRPRHGARTDTNISERPLACPFNKYDNRLFGPGSPDETYRACASCSFMNVAHLKQHLQRNHYLPQYYCYRCCKRDFSSQAMLAQHLRQEPICNKLEPPLYQERIGPDLIEELGLDRKNPAGTDRVEYWYRIYNTFFPSASGLGLPSPYYEGPAADYLNRFLHFSALALVELIPGVRRRLGMMGELSPDELSHLIQNVQQEAGQQYLERISSTLMPRLGCISSELADNSNNALLIDQPRASSHVGLQQNALESRPLERIEEQSDSIATSSGSLSNNPNANLSSATSTHYDSDLPKEPNNTLQFGICGQYHLPSKAAMTSNDSRSDDEQPNNFICDIPSDVLIEGNDWEAEIDLFLQPRTNWEESLVDISS